MRSCSACAGRQPVAEDRPLIPALAAYRMDIRQGNVVDAAMLARLQLGMDRERVRTLMGTPQLAIRSGRTAGTTRSPSARVTRSARSAP